MTAHRLHAALLIAVAVPLVAATAAAALKAGHRRPYAERHRIELKPRRSCPDCRGTGGWWTSGANPEMEACGCWSDRRELRVRPLPGPAWPDEPPF
ncbi:hypothetical protein ACFY8K_35930 [Streptomyces misionensis]|uniref:hypothetical protein n=1 Tax=Streptomyces misionensis TaxID=67331 RepID=UPI0036CCA824